MQVVNPFVQRLTGLAGTGTTYQQHGLVLGHSTNRWRGQNRPALARCFDLCDDPLLEELGIARSISHRSHPIPAHGLEQGWKKIIGRMDLLIFGVTHFILSGFVANHQSHLGCIFRPGAASQFAIEGALADFDAQVAEGIGLHPQGAQHQAFGIAADQRVVVQAVGGADRLGLELKLPGLASQTQGQALVPGHLLAFRLGGAGEDFFRDGFRQFGKIAEKCGHFGGQRRRRIHRCPQTLQGVG
ncbi:hypothetical protein D3C81_1274080 [compost metagenome]